MGAMRRTACASAAVFAVGLVLAWSATRVHFLDGGNWTALFCTGAGAPLPPEVDAGTYRVPPRGGYDGQYYRLLAHDPFLARNYARFVDSPQFRFRRCLVPMAAWLLALGQEPWIDRAYIAVEMLFIAMGTYWCARLLVRRGRPAWWGLFFVVVPATLASFDRMLLDGPLTALFAGFWLYCEEERWTRVWVLAALAGLTRETGLLLPAALVADRLLRRDWRGAGRFAACAVPSLAWYALLAARFPASGRVHEIGIPLWNLARRLLVFRPYYDPVGQAVLRVTDFLAVAGLIACVILAALRLRKQPMEPVTICAGLYAGLALILGPAVMADPFAFGRVISPLLVWIAIEALVRRQWAVLAAPLAISLNVGLVFVRPAIGIVQAFSK
jgi:hypothetical protein